MQKEKLKQILLNTNCFIDNEYLAKYCELIENNKATKIEKGKTQFHHIIPRSYYKIFKLEEDNSQENLLNLLYKDHILAHYYLCLCCSNNILKGYLSHAFIRMGFQLFNKIEDFNPNKLDDYQKLYEQFVLFLNNRKYTQEQKDNISKGKLKHSIKGKPNYKRRGQSFKRSQESNLKISKALKGRVSPIKGKKINRPFKFNIDSNIIINYYIKENHFLKECLNYFKCSQNCFYSYLKRNKIIKITSTKLDNLINSIDKEYFINYYLSHSLKETQIHFNIDNNYINKLRKTFNINKKYLTFNEIIESLNREELYDYYINQNHNALETAVYFNIGKNTIFKILKYFNIKKFQTTSDALKNISYDDLYIYYIDQNHSHLETCSHFNISVDILNNILRKYNLGKRSLFNA